MTVVFVTPHSQALRTFCAICSDNVDAYVTIHNKKTCTSGGRAAYTRSYRMSSKALDSNKIFVP